MVKHTQTIVGKLPANCLSVFDRFVGSAPKGLGGSLRKQSRDSSIIRYNLWMKNETMNKIQTKIFLSISCLLDHLHKYLLLTPAVN